MNTPLKRTWTQININNLENNLNCIKKQLNDDCKIMAIVKADAYGHGAPFIANVLAKDEKIAYFAVSNIDEACQIRHGGIIKDILILGFTPEEFFENLVSDNITQTVFSVEYATLLSNFAKSNNVVIKVHIKIDSGMGRIGFMCSKDELIYNSINDILKVLALPNLEFEGIFTHFAVSDELEKEFTIKQYNNFTTVIKLLNKKGFDFKWKHCSNSAAIISFPEMQLNMVRPGIILYGLYPSSCVNHIGLKPVMSLKTTISQIKEVDEDITISYGRTYKTSRKTIVATMPIGYADGFPRILSNNGDVLVNDTRAPIIGRICMDMTMIDITNVNGCKTNQTVTIFGEDIKNQIPVEELAEKMHSINYETICLIGKRVPRIYIKDGKEIDFINYIAN
ncbi:MAG: alanine racemase [Clostridia bacterium]